MMFLPQRLTLRVAWIGLAIASLASTRAEELQLANGDRLSGRVVERTATHLVFESPLLGRLSIPTTAIKALRTDSAPAAAAADPAPASVAVAEDSTPVDALAGLPPSDPVTADGPAAQVAKATPRREPWKGKVEVGFRQQAGRRDVLNLDLRASAERKIRRNRLTATSRVLYGEQDGKLSSSRIDAGFRWRRDLSERVFAQSFTSYYHDAVKAIDHNVEQNIGAGIRLWENPKQVVNVGAGVTAQYRATEAAADGSLTLFEMFQDYSLQLTKNVKLVQNANAQYSPANTIPAAGRDEPNYKLRFDTTLQGKLTNSLSLNLRYEYEYDKTLTVPGDQRISSSIGYGF